MPAYVGKETGNGRKGYLESLAEDYEREQAALRAAHEAAAPTFTIWGVECPILFGSSSIRVRINGEDWEPVASEAEKETGWRYALFLNSWENIFNY
jgi:hypothetical protein